MNFKTTIALVVLLAIVGAYFLFVELKRPAASPPGTTTGVTLQDEAPLFTADQFATDAIDRVTIERGDATYVFAKEGADWWQVEPVRFKLSAWASGTLVDRAASTKLYETLKGRSLDNAFATITLTDSSADKSFKLALGESTISGRAMATLNDGKDVLLVSDALHNTVRDLKVNDLRAKVLDAPGPAQADALLVQREGGGLALHKSINGLWYLDAEHTQRAATPEAERLVNAFARLGVDQFIADAPDTLDMYGLSNPRMTVTLTTPDRSVPGSDTAEPGAQVTLKVGRAADLDGKSFYAVRTTRDGGGDVVFTVTQTTLAAFEKPAADLRDPALFAVKPAEVRTLTIQSAGKTLKLQREGSGRFTFVEPTTDYAADYSEVTALIEQATALKAQGFDAGFTPTGEPVATITLNDAAVAFYTGNDAYWALRAGESVASNIPSEAIGALLTADASLLRNRTVIDLKREDVAAVTLTRAGHATMRFVRDASGAGGGKWSLEGHDTFEAEAFEQLLTLLSPLRAEQWTQTVAMPGEVVAEVKIETKTGPAHTLTVGNDFAFVEGVDDTFAISVALRNRLLAEYRPRTVVRLVPTDIASVTRTHDGDSRTVTLANNQFTWDTGDTLNVPAAAALYDALAGLRVQRFVTHQTFAAETPAWTFTVTPAATVGTAPITLKLMSDGVTATLDPAPAEPYRQWFTLDEETVKKLTAPLSEREQPLPDAADLIESK